jgi:hypothetical protein
LDINDQLGAFELRLKPCILPAQAGVLNRLRVRLATAFSRRQALEFAPCALLPPGCEVRRVQVFPTQQRAHLAGLSAGVGFLQNALLILGREVSVFGSDGDFRVRHSRR